MVSGEIPQQAAAEKKIKKQLLLTDNRQSVTQGKNDFLHTRIPRHQIIEGFDTDCLQVCAMGLFFQHMACLLYTSPSPRDVEESRMPSSA